jgi:hypothetical protein
LIRAFALLIAVSVPSLAAAQEPHGEVPQGAGGSPPQETPAAGAPAARAAGQPSEKARTPDPSTVPTVRKLDLGEVVRGTPVRATGSNLPDKERIRLELGGVDIGQPLESHGDFFTFVVPAEAPLGQHLLRISVTPDPNADAAAAGIAVSGMTPKPIHTGYLHVIGDQKGAFKLSRVEPTVISPETDHLIVVGEGLGGPGRDFALLLDGKEVPLCWDAHCKGFKARFVSPYELRVEGRFDAPWCEANAGTPRLSMRRGDLFSENGLDLRVVPYRSSAIRDLSLLVSAAVVALLLMVAFWGNGSHTVLGQTYRARAFLIDTETDTYSLSKLQFYAWSAAALFGYCYLALSRWLVQGHVDIPDVPENLPGLLAVSAGTAVVSVGVTAARGPKAAGGVQPSFADLVSTAGVISPERLGLFLWTIVGIAAFLFAVIRADPLLITDLPKIPERLMVLSGISAAGYLGGKAVRKPGPIIEKILPEHGSLTLTIIGRNLARDAGITIEGKSLFETMKSTALRPTVVEPENNEDRGEPQFGKILKLKTEVDPTWFASAEAGEPVTLTLKLTNQDGQSATWPFDVPPELVAKLTPGGARG